MKQECPLAMVWLFWLCLPGLALLVGFRQGWLTGAFVFMAGVGAQLAYLRHFPRLSRWLGYGSVQDAAAAVGPSRNGLPRVTLYTASVCPFCPIIRSRLQALRRDLGFELEERDVTFHPQLVREKGFRSVPVVEADGRYLVGNATSRELAAFLHAA